MASPDTKRRVLELGILLMPVAMMKLVAPMFGGGVENVTAAASSSRDNPAASMALVEAAWSDEQMEAARYLATADRGVGVSPFRHEKLKQERPVRTETPVEPVVELRVTMIMQAPGGGIALVNGETCRLETVIGGKWRIVGIDAAGRSVAFEHVENGERRVRGLED